MKRRNKQIPQLVELTAVFENETITNDYVYLSEIDLLESYLKDELIKLLNKGVKSC
jgi:hypothetical protein